MKSYQGTSGNVVGGFPLTAAKNSSTGVSTDGTPYVADYLNDIWQLLQGLMDRSGAMTPSGTVESYVQIGSGSAAGLGSIVGNPAMQHLQSMQAHFGAPGEIVMDFFGLAGSALGFQGHRVFALTGQVMDGWAYPDVWYNCWVGAAANPGATIFYTTSDAGGTTRATTGLTVNGVTGGRYLVLPDCRGLSPIGLGTNTKFGMGSLPTFASGGSTLGAYLADMMQAHQHTVTSFINGFTSGAGFNALTLSGTGQVNNTFATVTDGANGTPRTGLYTRTPGFACNIGMRF